MSLKSESLRTRQSESLIFKMSQSELANKFPVNLICCTWSDAKKKKKNEIKTREMTRAISARAESTTRRATADSFAKLKYARVSGSCNQSLGMESGDIPDSAITASSSYVTNVGPRNGRWVHYFYDIPFSTTLSFNKTEREIEGKEIQKESEKEIEKEKEKAEREGGKQTDTLH